MVMSQVSGTSAAPTMEMPLPAEEGVRIDTADAVAADGGEGVVPDRDIGVAENVVCNLLGVVPHEPVISPQGYIFEKRAIETYLDSTGKFCPVTREALTAEQLLKVATLPSQIPLAPQPHSIPNLIQLLRNDMDTLLLENFMVKSENKSLKQELSTTLYTDDAATRLLVKAQREHDALRERAQQLLEANSKLQSELASGVGLSTNPFVAETPSFPDVAFCEEMKQLEEHFRAERKEKKKKKEKEEKEDFSVFEPTVCAPLHSTTEKGIRCLALHPENETMVVTGGVDGTVVVFDIEKRQLVDQFKINVKNPRAISAVACYGDYIVAGAEDGSVGVFQTGRPGEWQRGYVKLHALRYHKKAVTGATFHPVSSENIYFLTSSRDKSYAVVNAGTGDLVCHKKEESAGVTSSSYHPGGGMVALGRADGSLEIQALHDSDRPGPIVFERPSEEANAGAEQLKKPDPELAISSVRFNSNCTNMASATVGGLVKLWDLRRPAEALQTLEFPRCEDIFFDRSGKYLLICAEAVHLYAQQSKDAGFTLVKTLAEHRDTVTAAAFGKACIASVSMDRDLRIYERPEY
ncbi:unnamed protein product [Amoebophrya sp. A25]|nr:unnamed protein product [Amoebophrya sp. A25]|eukprot:GSA25T00022601001.1